MKTENHYKINRIKPYDNDSMKIIFLSIAETYKKTDDRQMN